MREWVGQWLVGQFSLFGVPFQNWMAVAALIVLLWIVSLWLGRRLRDREDDARND
jgi:hypothetical protein